MSKQNDFTEISIYIDGNELGDSIQVHSIIIEKAVNAFSTAEVVFLLANESNPFGGTEMQDYAVGTPIEIKDKSSPKTKSLFKGMIRKQGLKILDGNLPAINVSCVEEPSKLDQQRKTRMFLDIKESEAIERILGDNNVGSEVDASVEKQIEIFQYELSDWKMILRLAAKNSMLVFSEADQLKVSSPKLDASPKLELSYGDSILDMDLQQDTSHQYLISQPLSLPTAQGEDSISIKDASDLVKGKLSGGSGLKNTGKELSAKSKQTEAPKRIIVNEAEMAQLKGRICIHGDSSVKPGDMISLKGLGNIFSGKAFLQKVEHQIAEGNWISYLTLGLPEQWNKMPAFASNSSCPKGLQRARVLKLENDPAGAYRIKVQLPGMQEEEGIWAKFSQFSASNNSGAFFLPEIGDEVVIGFEEAPEVSPIVVGMLYNQKHSPPLAYSDENPIKQLKTRSGHSLAFDDEQKSIELKTADGKRIYLDNTKILLEDKQKNKVSIDSSGISLESKSDITLKADKNINLQAKSNISIKADANVDLQGLNVKHKANAQFSASGNAGVELKTSAIAIIQGSLVKIN